MANAQNRSGASLHVGAFFPTQGELRSETSDAWYSAGVDFQPTVKYHPLGGNVHVGFDAAWRGGGSNRGRTLSFTGKLIWPINPKGHETRFWGGMALGLWVISTPNTSDLITVGSRFIAGVDITSRIYLEADYDWVSGFTDDIGHSIRVDGASVVLGVRF